jgi:hypothetical protein
MVKPSSNLRTGAFINEKSHQAFSASGMKFVYPMGRPCKNAICSLMALGYGRWAKTILIGSIGWVGSIGWISSKSQAWGDAL